MTVKPRTALYHVLGKTKFLLTAIFMTVALLISIVSNSFTELLYFMPDLKLWMTYIPAAIMNLLAIDTSGSHLTV